MGIRTVNTNSSSVDMSIATLAAEQRKNKRKTVEDLLKGERALDREFIEKAQREEKEQSEILGCIDNQVKELKQKAEDANQELKNQKQYIGNAAANVEDTKQKLKNTNEKADQLYARQGGVCWAFYVLCLICCAIGFTIDTGVTIAKKVKYNRKRENHNPSNEPD